MTVHKLEHLPPMHHNLLSTYVYSTSTNVHTHIYMWMFIRCTSCISAHTGSKNMDQLANRIRMLGTYLCTLQEVMYTYTCIQYKSRVWCILHTQCIPQAHILYAEWWWLHTNLLHAEIVHKFVACGTESLLHTQHNVGPRVSVACTKQTQLTHTQFLPDLLHNFIVVQDSDDDLQASKLAPQTQEDQHHKEEDCPKRGYGHAEDGLRERNKGQPWTLSWEHLCVCVRTTQMQWTQQNIYITQYIISLLCLYIIPLLYGTYRVVHTSLMSIPWGHSLQGIA